MPITKGSAKKKIQAARAKAKEPIKQKVKRKVGIGRFKATVRDERKKISDRLAKQRASKALTLKKAAPKAKAAPKVVTKPKATIKKAAPKKATGLPPVRQSLTKKGKEKLNALQTIATRAAKKKTSAPKPKQSLTKKAQAKNNAIQSILKRETPKKKKKAPKRNFTPTAKTKKMDQFFSKFR